MVPKLVCPHRDLNSYPAPRSLEERLAAEAASAESSTAAAAALGARLGGLEAEHAEAAARWARVRRESLLYTCKIRSPFPDEAR